MWPTLDQRRDLCSIDVTLDGKPARIAGAKLPFAIVREAQSTKSVEFAWETVVRIIANGGAFRSC